MSDTIIEIICEILDIEKETLLNDFDNNNIWESLHRVEILFAIEDEFDVFFSEEELAELNTPKKLHDAVLRKVD